MKKIFVFILSILCIFTIVTPGSAYRLHPLSIKARLKGKILIAPNENGPPKPFECKITMHLKTRGIIDAAKADDDCNGLTFSGLPWYIGIINAKGGQFGPFGFISEVGNCNQSIVEFKIDKSGIWTFTAGQCLSGSLPSTPAVTIGR